MRTSSGEVIRFSTASTTPSFVFNPIAVEPSCYQIKTQLHFQSEEERRFDPVYMLKQFKIQFRAKSGNCNVSRIACNSEV